MTVRFERPVGAPADVAELEYISALHQSDMVKGLRENGSIFAIDIVRFLKSRYGLLVSEEQVRQQILVDLAGESVVADADGGKAASGISSRDAKDGNNRLGPDRNGGSSSDQGDSAKNGCMDLMELAAVLLIPSLLKSSIEYQSVQHDLRNSAITRKSRTERVVVGETVTNNAGAEVEVEDGTPDGQMRQDRSGAVDQKDANILLEKDNYNDNDDGLLNEDWIKPVPNLIPRMYQTLLAQSNESLFIPTSGTNAPILNEELLRRILNSYGEHEMAQDHELLREMVYAASARDANASAESLEFFTAEALSHGISSDVMLWDLRKEKSCTTLYDDALVDSTGTPIYAGKQSATTLDGNDGTAERIQAQSLLPSTKASADSIAQPTSQQAGNKHQLDDNDHDEEGGCRDRSTKFEMSRVNTIPSIDSTASTFRSKAMFTSLWAMAILASYAYAFRNELSSEGVCESFEYTNSAPWRHNSESMLCHSFSQIVVWIFRFTFLILCGFVIVCLGSMGNSDKNKSIFRPLVGIAFVACYIAIPRTTVPSENVRGRGLLDITSHIFGLCVIVLHLSNFLTILLSPKTVKKYSVLRNVTALSKLTEERDSKQAAAYKINSMIQNALNVAVVSDETVCHGRGGKNNVLLPRVPHSNVPIPSSDKTFRDYYSMPTVMECTGGFLWTWQRIFDGTIRYQYGIQYSSRILSANLTQYVVCAYMVLAGRALLHKVNDDFDKETTHDVVSNISNVMLDRSISSNIMLAAMENITLVFGTFLASQPAETVDSFNCSGAFNARPSTTASSGLCQLIGIAQNKSNSFHGHMEVLDAAGFDVEVLEAVIRTVMNDATESAVNSLYPSSKYMVTIPLVVGTIVAFFTALYLATTFLPSTTSTVLKLRTGVIPTLHDREFFRYRLAQDHVAILTGSIFWGAVLSSILVGGLFGSLVFVYIWQATAYFAQRFTTLLIGLLVVCLIRLLLVLTCRHTMYVAFFRKRPGAANLTVAGLEWAAFNLSVGFVFLRAVKLVLATAFFVGRVDTPCLARGVGMLGPLNLDNYPTIFIKGILAHEAHRHPFMDLLGSLYLKKLRHGREFGDRAGSAWRLLFVHALMPWMRKYRLFRGEENKQFVVVQDALQRPMKLLLSLHRNRHDEGGWRNTHHVMDGDGNDDDGNGDNELDSGDGRVVKEDERGAVALSKAAADRRLIVSHLERERELLNARLQQIDQDLSRV